ncbi:uncharacterized protein LOC141910516 [Tubulanus polymorphus]|uniref:uncharacterized protein LOC141910516 n=1 Tax=Tubulanus polymorphus TaxID=672921 RepID=UPI003DA286E7
MMKPSLENMAPWIGHRTRKPEEKQLREFCRAAGIKAKGTKSEIIEALHDIKLSETKFQKLLTKIKGHNDERNDKKASCESDCEADPTQTKDLAGDQFPNSKKNSKRKSTGHGLPTFSRPKNRSEANDQVTLIWNRSYEVEVPVAKVGTVIVTDVSLRTLRNKMWLGDAVIVASLFMICKKAAEDDPPRDWLLLDSHLITCIITGNEMSYKNHLMKKEVFATKDAVAETYNNNRSHWILVVLWPRLRSFIYLDPMGYNDDEANAAKDNFRYV